MSKVVRERLQQTIQCMEEATQVIGKKYSNTSSENMQENQLLVELLTEMQDLAIAFGTRIETLRGIGTQTVTELESYCECLFHVNESMGSLKLSDTIANLVKQMKCVRNAFEKDFPNKKEIVFLPYKASMWDSLESVWKAADADPECEAYVMPIPYYDKNPDGTFGTFHYEGEQYPDYVPITDYKEYNLEKRHPDKIYIHNPYDDCNFVTTVDPEYYSNKLQMYTDELVYIPYFVLDEVDSSNKIAVDSVKSYCITKGVMNADKVIVQSENMRQVYIKILEGKMGKTDYAGVKWTDKILGLGSPKFDKVCNTTRADIEIPGEWMKIIQKSDGSWKKIVFYNTGLSSLLHYDEQMLRKIRNVFKFFYEQQNDVVLLWRPHPLIESTLVSMRPHLYDEYEKIKKTYQEENWGIYDDSPDVDRAIVLSDAYYGDKSSVVELYMKTGKPIMMQNVYWMEERTVL